MNYRLDSSYTFTRPSKPKRFRRYAALVLLVIILLAFGNYIYGWFAPAAELVAYPFLRASTGALPAARNTFTTRAGLIKEVEELRVQNAILNSKLLFLNERSKELENLRATYGVNTVTATPLLARVISKPNQTPYDVVVVDVGSKTTPQIKVGQTAVVSGSILVGQVVEVGSRSSKIRLFSSGGIELPVLIGEAALPATAKGVGGGNFTLSLPRGTEVNQGDPIVASSFPQYILGQVDHIDSDPNDPFQVLRFRLAVNLFELNWVELYD